MGVGVWGGGRRGWGEGGREVGRVDQGERHRGLREVEMWGVGAGATCFEPPCVNRKLYKGRTHGAELAGITLPMCGTRETRSVSVHSVPSVSPPLEMECDGDWYSYT